MTSAEEEEIPGEFLASLRDSQLSLHEKLHLLNVFTTLEQEQLICRAALIQSQASTLLQQNKAWGIAVQG